MKIAVCTTTINIPQVLKRYDLATKYTDAIVQFFITGDTISPDEQIRKLLNSLSTRSHYLSFAQQEKIWPKLSEIIGPRKIQRRNFSYLMTKQFNPDYVITIDDDNAPVSIQTYFNDFIRSFYNSETKLKSLNSNKANPYITLNTPKMPFKRGCSVTERMTDNMLNVIVAKNTLFTNNVGVVQGIALGDPDIDAITRINTSSNDIKNCMSELAQKSIVDWSYPLDWVPYNSQNTIFDSKYLKYQFLFPWVGRYDDILASYLSQLILKKDNSYVKFGKPYVIQLRNKHNLIKDLKDQIWGMENMDKIIDEVLDPIYHSNEKWNCLQNIYFKALYQISKLCPDFDKRNIEAAEQFFKIIN